MKDLKPTCRIAVVQAAPVLFDKTACTDKAVRLSLQQKNGGQVGVVCAHVNQNDISGEQISHHPQPRCQLNRSAHTSSIRIDK